MKKLIFLTLIISACGKEYESTVTDQPTREFYNTTNPNNREAKGDVEIIKIRDCDYVFWHNSYGSDMEHYQGCLNTNHSN